MIPPSVTDCVSYANLCVTGSAIPTAPVPDQVSEIYQIVSGLTAGALNGIESSLAAYAFENIFVHYLVKMYQTDPYPILANACGLNDDNGLLGVMASSSNGGSSGSMAIPDWYRTSAAWELDIIKTPYGRNYYMVATAANCGRVAVC